MPTDNLAVSAQGFRRGANRVRKVSLVDFFSHSTLLTGTRICGKLFCFIVPMPFLTCGGVRWKDMKVGSCYRARQVG